MIGRFAARGAVAWAGLFVIARVAALHALGEWHVPEAAFRYKLDLTQAPSHASAGYYVHLPDGGLLHGTTPATVVTTEDGTILPSYLLWNNPESGFSIVFAAPGSPTRSVYVYPQPGRAAQTWKPDTGLTPSAILCAYPGRETMGTAQALAKLGRVEAVVHAENQAGIPKAPFSIGGDDTGHPKPGCFYLLSYVSAPVAGSYWFAPFIRTGQGEVLVDGARVLPRAHSTEWGGTGASVELSAGLHRVEVFQTAPGAGPYGANLNDGGLMYLAWRLPKEQLKKVEARVINSSEIAHSGACHLTAVESRDGAPLAVATLNPTLCYWFENEEPLVLFNLAALTAGQPAGQTWTWTFPEGATLEGANVQWLFPGFRESKVKLTVKSDKGVSSAIIPLFGFSTQPTSLDKAPTRAAFRDVLTKMLEGYPRNPDPVADWGDAWWNNILRTLDGGQGYPLLVRLFSDHLDAARKKLAPAQLYALQDLLLDEAERQNPREALQWLQKFQPAASEIARQGQLRIREGELLMYYLDDRKQAEQIFTALSGLQGEYGERARIRLGDLAFIQGDLNKATSFYADVQNRARFRRNNSPAASGGLVANQLVQAGAAQPANSPFTPQSTPKPAAAADQKGGALQDVSFSENVRSLTEDDYLLEAHQALLAWESEFPLSKISGDYIIR